MSEDRPLYLAIKRLIESLAEDPVQFLVVTAREKASDVQSWLDGTRYPSDASMSNIVDLVEDYFKWGELPQGDERRDALDHFWQTVEECERAGDSFEELPLGEDEMVYERLTDFTNVHWGKDISLNMCHIPPRRRRAFLEEIREIFQKYVPQDEANHQEMK